VQRRDILDLVLCVGPVTITHVCMQQSAPERISFARLGWSMPSLEWILFLDRDSVCRKSL
jgi:hypothetical protein